MVSPKPSSKRSHCRIRPHVEDEEHVVFLRFLPTIETHARIRFRNLPPSEQEDALAEAVAAAFCIYMSAHRRGRVHRINPFMLARFAVQQVRTGRRVGGTRDSSRDALSWRAQRRHGFEVHRVGLARECTFDCLSPKQDPVWRLMLLEDRQTPVAEQVQFRIDWSSFLSAQTDRTRRIAAMLAEGHRRVDVAEHFGMTGSAVTQRGHRLRRDWERFQGDNEAA